MSKSFSPSGYAPPENRNLKYSPNCVFYVNGDKFFPGSRICVSNRIRTLDGVKEELTKRLLKQNGNQSGCVRNVFTPVGGSRIRSLDEFRDGEHYVASINDKFKPLAYKEIQEKTRANYNKNKKIEPRSYTPVQHAVKEEHRKKSGRYKSWSDKYKGKRIKVHVNNYWTKAAHPVTILPKDVNNLLEIFKTIEKEMNIYPIGRIFRIDNEGRRKEEDFTELHSAEEINHNEHVLVVPHADKRIEFNTYRFDGLQDFHISTSPRHDRGFGTVPFTPYKHNKSLNSHKKLPSIGSSKQSDAQSPFSNAGSRGGGGRGRNPNANPNPKSKTRQVDYDNDSGGVYRAKKQNNARGAQQVNETRDTRVDKPIDQMEAEIVEEERMNEDAGMHNNDDFNDDSFNRYGYERNSPDAHAQTKEMRSSTPASRGESRPKPPSSRGESRPTPPASRGESRQKQMQKEKEAATKIQAGARGYKARKEIKELKENKQREQQAKQNQYDDRNKQDTPPPPPKQPQQQQQQQQQPPSQGQGQNKEMDADLAASKIQASFKGYKTRKELDTKKKQQGQK